MRLYVCTCLHHCHSLVQICITTHTCAHLCICVFMFLCISIHMYIYIYIDVCLPTFVHVYLYIQVWILHPILYPIYIYIYVKDMVYNSIYQTNSGQLNDKMEKLQSDTFHFHVNGGSLRLLEIYNKEWLHYYIKKLKDIAMIHFKFKSFIFKVSRCLTC